MSHLPPICTTSTQPPMLQMRGELHVQRGADCSSAVAGTRDAARVLGWVDDHTVVFTRYLPGDLPEERPYRVDLDTGVMSQVTAASDAHLYNVTWDEGRLFFARTPTAVVSWPQPTQPIELVEMSPDGVSVRVVATEVGAIPVDIRATASNKVAWSVEGLGAVRVADLQTGFVSTWQPPKSPARPGAPTPGPMDLLAMPYIHQVYDTPDEFDGNWACGPTSTVMAICHWGRLDPWPITVSTPSPHESDYGAYVSRQYTAYGTTFDRVQNDASGNPAEGAYGWCTDQGAAWASRMQDYAQRHVLSSDFDGYPTMASVQGYLDSGKVVVLATQLTSAGHIIAVKGYTADSKLVVNDPYGDKNQGI